MMKLDQLQPNTAIRGIIPDALVMVVSVQWFGSEALELTYKTSSGKVADGRGRRRWRLRARRYATKIDGAMTERSA